MRYSGMLLALLLHFSAEAQSFEYPAIKAEAGTVFQFIPEKWILFDSATGDLNKDGLKDMVMVIQLRDSISFYIPGEENTDTVITQPRILLILFRMAGKDSYRLMIQQNSFIPLYDSPLTDDPLVGISIKNSVISFQFHYFQSMGSWYISNNAYRFRYQQGQFVLIGADELTAHRATGEMETRSVNFITRKYIHTTGKNISGRNEQIKSTWKKIPEAKPILLQDLKSSELYRLFSN
jgi:hypothetical protein